MDAQQPDAVPGPTEERGQAGSWDEPDPRRSVGALIALVGAGLVVAGSALPWVVASSGPDRVTLSGTGGNDGWISLALGVVLAVLAIRNRLDPDAGTTGVLVVTTLLGLMTAYEVVDILGKTTPEGTSLSIGYGLWIMAAGVGASLVGVIRMKAA